MIPVEDYHIVFECWRSGQISDADMVARLAEDEQFRTWFLNRTS